MSIQGFFIELKDQEGWKGYAFRSKIVLCIETVYVIVQYVLNIFKFESVLVASRKEELTIVLGLGTEH